MINNASQFGRNAGIVWNAIKNNGCISKNKLMESTSLREYELCMAIGWLARENKIRRDEEKYSIDTTNLTYEIGTNAGRIWQFLYKEGLSNIQNILENTNLNYQELYQAIGWLARENKIKITIERNKL